MSTAATRPTMRMPARLMTNGSAITRQARRNGIGLVQNREGLGFVFFVFSCFRGSRGLTD